MYIYKKLFLVDNVEAKYQARPVWATENLISTTDTSAVLTCH